MLRRLRRCHRSCERVVGRCSLYLLHSLVCLWCWRLCYRRYCLLLLFRLCVKACRARTKCCFLLLLLLPRGYHWRAITCSHCHWLTTLLADWRSNLFLLFVCYYTTNTYLHIHIYMSTYVVMCAHWFLTLIPRYLCFNEYFR